VPSRKLEAELQALDEVFTALAHPTRRQIVMVIHFWGGTMTAGEIASRFGHAWPTTTRHLGVLTSGGLVVREKIGRTQHYRLCKERLALLESWLSWFGELPDQEGRAPLAEWKDSHTRRRMG
jgi:DNA-binding transcriptional ArsR family regulator